MFTWKYNLLLTAYTHPPSTKITFGAKPERKATYDTLTSKRHVLKDKLRERHPVRVWEFDPHK